VKDFGVGVFLLLGGVAVGIGLASFVLPMAPPKRESPSPLAGYAFSTRSLGATGTNALYFFADLARCERQRIDQLTATSRYPEDIFPPPPAGQHGQTVDACSARAARHVLREVLKDLQAPPKAEGAEGKWQ